MSAARSNAMYTVYEAHFMLDVKYVIYTSSSRPVEVVTLEKPLLSAYFCFFFFNDPPPTEISPLPLPAALPTPARLPRSTARASVVASVGSPYSSAVARATARASWVPEPSPAWGGMVRCRQRCTWGGMP